MIERRHDQIGLLWGEPAGQIFDLREHLPRMQRRHLAGNRQRVRVQGLCPTILIVEELLESPRLRVHAQKTNSDDRLALELDIGIIEVPGEKRRKTRVRRPPHGLERRGPGLRPFVELHNVTLHFGIFRESQSQQCSTALLDGRIGILQTLQHGGADPVLLGESAERLPRFAAHRGFGVLPGKIEDALAYRLAFHLVVIEASSCLPAVLCPRTIQEAKSLDGGQQVEARAGHFRVVAPDVVGVECRGGFGLVQPAHGVAQFGSRAREQPGLAVQSFLKFRKRGRIAVDAQQESSVVHVSVKPLEQNVQHARVRHPQSGQHKGDLGPFLEPEFRI